MDAEAMQAAFDEVFDQAIVFHAFTDYMRDYEVVTYSVADPRTGIQPQYDRFIFRYCVEAEVKTTVTPETWRKSLDDGLLDHENGKDLDGYVWGVRWHCLYPGARIEEATPRTTAWADALEMPLYEAVIETNAHHIRLVFGDLEVSQVEPGYAPFVTRL